MDAQEARDHIEMVDRILTRVEGEPVRYIPGLIIAWGLAAAAIDAGQQMAVLGTGGRAGLWLAAAALIAGIVYSVAVTIAIARGCRYETMTITEMRLGRIMGAVWFTVFVAAFAQPHVFAGWGGAAVWSMGAAIMMLMSGFSGDRRGLAGGLILLASVLAANYLFPHVPGYVLAAGFIFGYAVPGVLFLLQGPKEA
ncbi:MAG TPA: hypothetical protein VFE17_03825 [Candidatus Baltobacteraceae bacterium]|jgi:hypothetical protein|nr:hypothetical protein [Candidatus Baltobacteraceae bacterium]